MSELKILTQLASKVLERFYLNSKVAVVVGGSQGLGQGMALALAAAGADVCVVGLGEENLKNTGTAISSLGRKSYWIETDVTLEENVKKMVAQIVDFYGRIDILVNSQGAFHLQDSVDFDTDCWQKVMDVNVKSVFLCCKHVGRILVNQRKGKIINISSIRSFQGRAGDLAYAPSKGAVNQLTRSLAIEWGAKGVNVNAIAPVFIYTTLNKPILDDPVKRELVLSRIPMKRLGEREDLFGPVLFLASEASNLVNGEILCVDGGWMAA
jgi:2-deoxy-D-gluconate 3-dehydrogenase